MTYQQSESLILVGPMQAAPFVLPEALKGLPQVAVDGGVHAALNPVFWCGDGDSGFIPAGIPAVVKENQDLTDLSFCLSCIREWRWTEMHLFGFLGGRRDHEMANFGTIAAELLLRGQSRKAVFYDGEGRISAMLFPAGFHQMELRGIFSVLTLTPAIISLGGACRYQAEALEMMPLSGQGISNEGRGIVTLKTDKPAIIFTP